MKTTLPPTGLGKETTVNSWHTALVVAGMGFLAGIIALRNQDARTRRDAKLALVRSDGGMLVTAALAVRRAVQDMHDFIGHDPTWRQDKDLPARLDRLIVEAEALPYARLWTELDRHVALETFRQIVHTYRWSHFLLFDHGGDDMAVADRLEEQLRELDELIERLRREVRKEIDAVNKPVWL